MVRNGYAIQQLSHESELVAQELLEQLVVNSSQGSFDGSQQEVDIFNEVQLPPQEGADPNDANPLTNAPIGQPQFSLHDFVATQVCITFLHPHMDRVPAFRKPQQASTNLG